MLILETEFFEEDGNLPGVGTWASMSICGLVEEGSDSLGRRPTSGMRVESNSF